MSPLRKILTSLFIAGLPVAGAAVSASLLLLAPPAQAQTSKGILTGTVRDPAGAVVQGAAITVSSNDTGEIRHTTSNDQGAYRIEAINPGSYSVQVEALGFGATNARNVQVLPSVVTSYNSVLQLGTAVSSVQVEAVSNAINTDNAEISGTVGSQELGKVPIFSLNPIELATTIPGVQFVNDTSLNTGGISGNYFHIEVNGARPRANNFMFDGQDINDVGLGGQAFGIVIPDMFQSVTILTNDASAEYGRAGGAVVNMITKNGTNQYHGTLFELYSGSGLNSTDGQTREIVPKAHGNKARFDQHQFGFTAGGYIVKDKLFGFGASQWTRFYGNTNSTKIELPDAAGYATLNSIGGPQVALLDKLLSGGSYLTAYHLAGDPANPVETINVGQQNGCPASGCAVTTNFFERPPIAQQAPDLQWVFRVDYIPREKDTFTVRYLHDRATTSPDVALNTSGLPGFDGEVGGPSEFGGVSWTHVFSPKFVNELRASITRVNILFTATPDALKNPGASLPEVNFLDNGLPVLGLSQNIPQGSKENFYQFQDTVSGTRGRQSFRIGADVGRVLETDLVAQLSVGELNFTGGGGPSGLGNFLNNNLGASGSATKTFGPTRIDPHNSRTAYFAQDDVKFTSELSFTLGLRYDYLTDPGNSVPYPAVDPRNLATPINTVYKIQNSKENWGPRLGLAYAPQGGGWLGGGKTVYHGGFGIYYDTSFSNIVTNSAQAAPNAPTGDLISTQGAGLGNATGLLATITPQLSPFNSVSSIDKNIVNPRTYQWNFGLERELPLQLKMTANYVASRGRKLYANQHLNYFDFNTGDRIIPTRGAIDIRENTAASQYDSAQLGVLRQFSHGLLIRGAYTYGANFDDGSEIFATFNSPTSYSANLAPGGRSQDWSRSAFDFPHFFSAEYVWSPAGLHANNRGADTLLSVVTRNWTVSGVTQLQSGPPSTFNINGQDTNGDGSGVNDRPLVGNAHAPLNTAGIDGDYVGGNHGTYYDLFQENTNNANVPVDPSQVHWLIPHLDPGETTFVYREIGRNSFRNPGTTNWNVALERDIPTPWAHLEGSSLQFRVEAQDVGNHNDVGVLDTNLLHIGSGNSYLNPATQRLSTSRNVRFWLKFAF